MAVHWSEIGQVIIHVTSSQQNPLSTSTMLDLIFNGTNLARLQTATTQDQSKEACVLNFDPKSIDWEYYLYNSHIPGVMKYAHKKK
uniref:Fatty acyl-CoA reductase C-terminal domain-containing protein n=1 Tax=Oryza meridionalis TaxID=40149 RepID=A0A0E0EBB7_9ORYZ